jgi:hypothetical protein
MPQLESLLETLGIIFSSYYPSRDVDARPNS